MKNIRWLSLTDADGFGLLAAGMPLMEAGALHLTADDLFQALHTNELERRDEVYLYLDHLHAGLGGASCGPATLPQYRIKPGNFEFSFALRGIAPTI